MAITGSNNAGQSYSEINMTPLIDVMLVLLINLQHRGLKKIGFVSP
jgi:biopolymer transport protein ExbD